MATSTGDDVKTHKLDNGLRVLIKQDRSNPVVAINVWFGVGSVNETPEENGLAHFQEHMVFKGTERHGVGEIAKLIKGAGGNLNAGTSYSYTMYYVVMPSSAFELGMNVQADAMMNSNFPEEEFRKERLVVMDEARMYDDTPDSFTFYRTMELGFAEHNYRRPIAGYEEVVREFTRDQLVSFYQRYYRPANAVVVVVGDVDTDEALRKVGKAYGGWATHNGTVNDSPVEPPQDEFRLKTLRGAIDHAYLGAGFHVPNIMDKDYPALEMLSTLLSAGRSSRLYRRLIEKERLATSASASLLSEKWPGFFMMFASAPTEKWADARAALFEEVARFQDELVDDAELAKARRQIEKSLYSSLETVEGQASNLGYYETLGDYRMAERHREAIRAVSPAEILEAARRYFSAKNCSMISYLPDRDDVAEPDHDRVESELDRIFSPRTHKLSTNEYKAPARLTVRKASANGGSVVERSQLENGVTVLVKPRSTVPTVSVISLVEGGSRMDPNDKSGVSSLAARCLVKGTVSYTAQQIAETVEGLGGSIDAFAGYDVLGSYISVLSENIEEACAVYRDVLRQPAFSTDVVDNEKNRMLEELAKRKDHPLHFAVDHLYHAVFGNHPYARPYVRHPEIIHGLTPDDCRSWYSQTLAPERLTIGFVGDIGIKKARNLASSLLGDLNAPATAPPARPLKTVASPGRHELTRPHLRQAVGLVGFIAPPTMHKDTIALTVLNGIMTGLGGRLFVELRDKRSLGYMTGSALLPLKDGSMFYGFANPGPEGVQLAIDVIMTELEKVTREPVTDEELANAKRWLIGSQTMRLQRNLSQAIEYATYEALGFGYKVVEEVPAMLQAVTQEDILRAAKRVFREDAVAHILLLPEDSA